MLRLIWIPIRFSSMIIPSCLISIFPWRVPLDVSAIPVPPWKMIFPASFYCVWGPPLRIQPCVSLQVRHFLPLIPPLDNYTIPYIATAPHYLAVDEKIDLCSAAAPQRSQEPIQCLQAVVSSKKSFTNRYRTPTFSPNTTLLVK